ncbi:MAG: methyltransferase [Hyphomonadaceae bacterium]|nr:methyltransferase [Hyphomonadaceae bacterium]
MSQATSDDPGPGIEGDTLDMFLGGRLRLRQPAVGYRAGADAVLLAAAVAPGAHLMEAGCGAGAALLATALRHPQSRLTGIEREAPMAAFARENARANALSDRVDILDGDALAPGPTFDGVFCNPPYAEVGEGQAPHAARRHAHVTEVALDGWVAALSNRLRGGGVLTMIHRADRLDRLLAAMDGRLGGVRVYPVRPRADTAAHRVIVAATKGSRAPVALLKGLDLHGGAGAGFTPEADAIFRGEAAIPW